MNVGFVHAAWVHESCRGCNAELNEGGERFAVCKVSLTTGSFASSRVWVGTWIEVILEPSVGGTLGLKDSETIDAVGGEFELIDEILGYLWVGRWYSGRWI